MKATGALRCRSSRTRRLCCLSCTRPATSPQGRAINPRNSSARAAKKKAPTRPETTVALGVANRPKRRIPIPSPPPARSDRPTRPIHPAAPVSSKISVPPNVTRAQPVPSKASSSALRRPNSGKPVKGPHKLANAPRSTACSQGSPSNAVTTVTAAKISAVAAAANPSMRQACVGHTTCSPTWNPTPRPAMRKSIWCRENAS